MPEEEKLKVELIEFELETLIEVIDHYCFLAKKFNPQFQFGDVANVLHEFREQLMTVRWGAENGK